MDKREKLLKEIIKCGTDPVYFMTHYTWVQHPVRGLVRFSMYPYQIDTVNKIQTNRRNIIVKSRQIGISETVAQYILWLALFHKDKVIAVVSKSQDASNEIIRRIKMSYAKLPEQLKISTFDRNSVTELRFDNRSLIKAYGLTEDVARGKSISFLFVDEAAAIDIGESMWQSVSPTLSEGGGVIIVSTPKGQSNWFYSMYENAEKGRNGFIPMKLPWTVHPEHDDNWFETETRDKSSQQIKEEYLADFMGSGETFIDEITLNHIRDNRRAPTRTEMSDKLWIWEDPKPSHLYAISCDPSRGDAADNAGIIVMDYTVDEQVAEFYGVVDAEQQAKITLDLAIKYNNADIIFDNTAGYGAPLDIMLKNEKYENRFYWRKKTADVVAHKERYRYSPNELVSGYNLNAKTRPIVLANLDVTLRQQVVKIYSDRIYKELLVFNWSRGKAQADAGKHDDLVLSLALNLWCRSSTVRRSADELKFLKRAPDLVKTSSELNSLKPMVTAEQSIHNIGKKTGFLTEAEKNVIRMYANLIK